MPKEINIDTFKQFISQYYIVLNWKWDDFIPEGDKFLSGSHTETLIIDDELIKEFPLSFSSMEISYKLTIWGRLKLAQNVNPSLTE